MNRPLHIDYRLRAAGWKHCEICFLAMPGTALEEHRKAKHSGAPVERGIDDRVARAMDRQRLETSRNALRSNFSRKAW